MISASSEGFRRGRSLQALVWAAAAVTISASLVFASTSTANATAVGAIFSSANFSLGRWSLERVLVHTGPRRLLYGLLFVSKLSVLVGVLTILMLKLKLDLGGMLLGFTVLPLALYGLLARELLGRLKKPKG